MNTPNKLTLIRVLLIPVYIFVYLKEMYVLSIIVFSIASITDYFDGQLARKNNLVTNFGKIMDPLADKALVYTAFVLLSPYPVYRWMIIVILFREFLVSGIRIVAASNGKVIAAAFSGKAKTFVQMFAVPFLLLSLACPLSVGIDIVSKVLLYASLALTVYSGAEYTIKNIGVFKD